MTLCDMKGQENECVNIHMKMGYDSPYFCLEQYKDSMCPRTEEPVLKNQ